MPMFPLPKGIREQNNRQRGCVPVASGSVDLFDSHWPRFPRCAKGVKLLALPELALKALLAKGPISSNEIQDAMIRQEWKVDTIRSQSQ